MDFLKNNSKQSSQSENKESRKEQKGNDIDKKKIENYRDPITKVSLKKLKAGLWYVKHRPLFIKSLLGVFILITIGMWLYVIIGFGWYIFKGMEEDENMINELTRQNLTLGLKSRTAGQDVLTYSSITTFRRGDKYDLMLKINNPEDKYRAEFDYCFIQGEEKLDCQENFIFPGESKYILSLSHELQSSSNIEFEVKNINWTIINPHKIPDWEQYKKEHLDFEFTDVEYSSGNKSEYSDKINLNSLKFNAHNATSYGYWEADLNIFLYDTGKITGVNRYTINRFDSGMKEEVELVWPGNIGRVTDVSIIPDLNIMDKSNYIQPRD
jgi:hypothetical protein